MGRSLSISHTKRPSVEQPKTYLSARRFSCAIVDFEATGLPLDTPLKRVRAQSKHTKDARFRFLSLPGEIRNQVYREYFCELEHACVPPGDLNPSTKLTPKESFAPFKQLLQSCRQIRAEASSIFYHEYFPRYQYRFNGLAQFGSFVQVIGVRNPSYQGRLVVPGVEVGNGVEETLRRTLRVVFGRVGKDVRDLDRFLVPGGDYDVSKEDDGQGDVEWSSGQPYVLKGEGWGVQLQWVWGRYSLDRRLKNLSIRGDLGRLDWSGLLDDQESQKRV